VAFIILLLTLKKRGLSTQFFGHASFYISTIGSGESPTLIKEKNKLTRGEPHMSQINESISFESPFTNDDLTLFKQRIAIELVKQNLQQTSGQYTAVLSTLKIVAVLVFMACMLAAIMLPVALLHVS
jgi:hypothetical protein